MPQRPRIVSLIQVLNYVPEKPIQKPNAHQSHFVIHNGKKYKLTLYTQ